LLVETDDDDSTDSNSEDELAKAARKKLTSTELLASAFLYQKDLLHCSDHQSKLPFDCSDKSIVIVCQELRHHGFGFLMDDTKLDTYQLDLLNTVKELSKNNTVKDIIISKVKSDKESANSLINETTTKDSLRCTFPL
jgi:hypothetical protein